MSTWLCFQDETPENDWEWSPIWISAPDEQKAKQVYARVMDDAADRCVASDEAYLVSARWEDGA